MQDSNIYFATNTYNYGKPYVGEAVNKFNEKKGDVEFFRQVMDYDALKRFRSSHQMNNNFTTSYYVATARQIKVLDPNFSVMIGKREKDPKIEEENEWFDAEYGYDINNDYYPLIEEIIIDDEELTYADELFGEWENNEQPSKYLEDAYGLYIKNKAKKETYVNILLDTEGFVEINERDPYYYNYAETAGKATHIIGSAERAKLFEETYGSIFNAFKEVEQKEIIEAPVSQRTFVNAGPGTGKTYTLIQRIIYMVEVLGVNPEEILVLCFTNAAVNEIKARIKQYADDGGDRTFINVDVRTFHSFAWLLISQANELFAERNNYKYIDLGQLKSNYDRSLNEATKIIRKYGDEIFGGCSHLIVDEIQDLTDERATIVLTMIQECIKNDIGFTVLGDSCQAIYDYSEDGKSLDIKSSKFYKHLFSEMYEGGEFLKLEKNLRQSDYLIKTTDPLRQVILKEKKSEIHSEISRLNNIVNTLIKGNLSVKYSKHEFDRLCENGTVCLLCRNNAQVLATSSNLHKLGIPHFVNAYEELDYYDGWIGRTFGLYTKEIISYDEFKKMYNNPNKTDYDIVWNRLLELIGTNNNVLKIFDVYKAIGNSKIDDPIFRNTPTGKLIVSNIHKSKGREYDTVVVEQKFLKKLVNDSTAIKSVQEYIEEAKTLYVAITRPRTRLYFNNLATANVSLKIINNRRKRWVRGDGKNLKSIEVRAFADVDIDSYNSADIQEYIINNVRKGDEIKLMLNEKSSTITYYVIHTSINGDRVIGRVSKEFIEDVDTIISPYNSPWPRRITDLFVSGVYSHISNKYDQAWCWVDFCGIGEAHTDVY